MPDASPGNQVASEAAIEAVAEALVEAFDEIVKPDGGSVRLLGVEAGLLRVAYAKGVNEHCVECIMEPDALAGMMKDMLNDQAPEIREVSVEVAAEA